MADRQREFLMAANHFRAGRITIDDFKKKVLAATAAQGCVALVFKPSKDAEDVSAAIAEIKLAGAKTVKIQLSDAGDLPEVERLRKKLQPAGAVVVIGLTDHASVSLVVKEATSPVLIVPNKDCKPDELKLLAEALASSAVLVGKGEVSSAAKMAASVARP